jgi:hypothetical protein
MELTVKRELELTKTRKKLELNRQRLLVLSPQRLYRTAGGVKTVDDPTTDGNNTCTCTYHP